MDYVSKNIVAPDLRPIFKHLHWRDSPAHFGHTIASDWADKAADDPVFGPWKECSLLTMDEAALVWNISRRLRRGDVGTRSLDIGSHTGWSTAHLIGKLPSVCDDPVHASTIDTGKFASVVAVDPMLKHREFADRLNENLSRCGPHAINVVPWASEKFFAEGGYWHYDLVLIDGNHDSPFPLEDAKGALAHLAETGVVVFHDFWGWPIRDGVRFLLDAGLKCRVYDTPNGMAVCWRGDFTPPDHVPDPAIDWAAVRAGRCPEFDFSRTQ